MHTATLKDFIRQTTFHISSIALFPERPAVEHRILCLPLHRTTAVPLHWGWCYLLKAVNLILVLGFLVHAKDYIGGSRYLVDIPTICITAELEKEASPHRSRNSDANLK